MLLQFSIKSSDEQCFIFYKVWFFEHLRPRKLDKGTRRIPRYLIWKFEARERFRKLLVEVPAGQVISDPINKVFGAKLISLTGFRASKYVAIRHHESYFRKHQNQDLAYLLQQMAPISSKLHFPICPLCNG